MSTFNERLNLALGGPYESFMRRSIQTVILFEAHRCLKDKLPSLRPFQKKMAIYDQANHLLNATSLTPDQRQEVMWRTGTSQEGLNADMMWRRTRCVVQDVKKLANQMEAFGRAHPLKSKGDEEEDGGSKTEHEELYRAFLQKAYNDLTGKTGEPFPPRFEFTHNNCLVLYKMYFNKGNQMDASFPPPEKRDIAIPDKKPKGGVVAFLAGGQQAGANDGPHVGPFGKTVAVIRSPPASPMALARMHQQKRMEQLREVREHMDLLKQFEGVVDEEVLNKRKRELFEALPPAPPAFGRIKKQQMVAAKADETSKEAAGEENKAQSDFIVV
jgi:hypothetical protein